MTVLDRDARALIAGFSTPLDDWDGELLTTWLLLRTRRRAQDFAADLRTRAGLHPGLLAMFDRAADHIAARDDVWHPATGVILKHRRYHERSESAAAEMALFWHERGVPGAWTLSANPGEGQQQRHFAGYRIDGPLLSFEGDGQRALIETVDGAMHQFVRQDRAWTSQNSERVRLLCDDGFAPAFLIEQWPLRFRCDDQDGGVAPDADYRRRLTAALQLLRAQSPRHHDWVTRLVRLCLPLERQGSAIRSWSSGDYPGLIALCANGTPIEIAETLVHEASHQHFHALKQFGDMVVPGEAEMAYSPVKNCLRPMEMILLSYHAFANVQLFFRGLLRDRRIAADWYLSHCGTLLDWRPVLEGALRDSRTLTPLGHQLWQHLSARLDEEG